MPAFARPRLDGLTLSIVTVMMIATAGPVAAQALDCGRLQQQIAQGDRGGGNRYAGAARKQASELGRTQAYAHQLGCDAGFSFFGGNPQCGALTQRIQQMQANLSQLQAAGGGSRADLIARFNASCRGAPPQPQQPRGFFESIFGGPQQEAPRQPLPEMQPDGTLPGDDDGTGAHGGSQAVCVRTCDGGFFPLGVSARRGGDTLNDMCSALCPGTEAAVYTRNPDADIKTAMSIDGKPYMDLPNALHFTKSVTPACSCLPAGKTWAEALANAEDQIGHAHKGDIMVTPEKSDELSRPKLDPAARSSLLAKPTTAMVMPSDTQPNTTPPQTTAPQTTSQDGVKHAVRRVGPQP